MSAQNHECSKVKETVTGNGVDSESSVYLDSTSSPLVSSMPDFCVILAR